MTDSSLPLVTVVTVTYQLMQSKREYLFRNCVESIHRQTYPAIEHLVIDGGSNDGSLDLIREYEAKGKLICISEPDKGIYDAMNKGLRLAKGKYIAFLNSDDCWHDPNGVARTIEQLERAKADFSYAPYNCLNSEGKMEYVIYPQIGSFPYTMPLCHQTMFTRTELMRQHGGFRFPLYRCAADYDLVVRLLISGAKPVYVPYNFTNFRKGGFSGIYEQLSRNEVEMIVKEHFGSYLEPNDNLEWIWKPHIAAPIALLQAVESLVHPSVAIHLHGYALGPWIGAFHITVGRPNLTPRATLDMDPTPKKVTWKLLHVLPFLSLQRNGEITSLNLFGLSFLNLLRIKNKHNAKIVCIFGFIPFMKIKTKVN